MVVGRLWVTASAVAREVVYIPGYVSHDCSLNLLVVGLVCFNLAALGT